MRVCACVHNIVHVCNGREKIRINNQHLHVHFLYIHTHCSDVQSSATDMLKQTFIEGGWQAQSSQLRLHAVGELIEGALLDNDIVSCQETSSGVILLRVGLEPANYLAPGLIGEE